MIEVWRNIPGYDGRYQVSREGEVRRVLPSGKTRLLKPHIKKNMSGSKRLIVCLTHNGKSREEVVMSVVAKVFLGPCPKGCVPYHKNGCQSDNYVNNIAYIERRKLGQMTGAMSRRKPVAKFDQNGEMIDVYSSAREAARRNYMGYQTILDRCNGVRKNPCPDGYWYKWDR